MKKLLLFVLLLWTLGSPALAVDTDGLTDALPEAARDILGAAEVSEAENVQALLEKIKRWGAEHIRSYLDGAVSMASAAAAVALLSAVAGSVSGDGKAPDFVCLGGALALSGLCFHRLHGYLTACREALYDLWDFSRALLPCIAAASTAAGHAASGAAQYGAGSLFIDLLLSVGTNIVLPLIYAYGAVAVAKTALPTEILDGVSKLIRWLCTGTLGLLCTAFTLYLTLTGAVSGKADALATGVAKTALSAALPVAGKILSDAASSYLAGAELLRGSIGVFGLAAVLCVCLEPALTLGLNYLLLKTVAAVTAIFAEKRLSGLIDDLGSACGMALGLVGSGGVMLFLSVVISTELLTG